MYHFVAYKYRKSDVLTTGEQLGDMSTFKEWARISELLP
jgi:hypothetical protein